MPGESISSAAVSLYLAPTDIKSLLFTYCIFLQMLHLRYLYTPSKCIEFKNHNISEKKSMSTIPLFP